MTETIFETLLKEMEEQQKLHHLPIVEKKAKQLLKLAEKEQNHYYESIAWSVSYTHLTLPTIA